MYATAPAVLMPTRAHRPMALTSACTSDENGSLEQRGVDGDGKNFAVTCYDAPHVAPIAPGVTRDEGAEVHEVFVVSKPRHFLPSVHLHPSRP
eukprot:CAMPEP_0180168444 /NCGR_PEP_ID=MMETSP0986-20121125/32683_1 /TAXON_ID=697907 /ORGANISM="non described non described, Strain CCMP2293" /LENGTH=92 /DNA_ID=CAMNT_0022119841 /DNA_START=462 /DNA_END=736 /DNA_ORIENTATION=+